MNSKSEFKSCHFIPSQSNIAILQRLVMLLFVFVIFFIFSQPLLDFCLGGFKNVTATFSAYDYTLRQSAILLLFVITIFWLGLIVLNRFKLHSHVVNASSFIPDVGMILIGIGYLYIRSQTFTLNGIPMSLAGFTWLPSIKYTDILLIPILFSACNISGILINRFRRPGKPAPSKWSNDKPLEDKAHDKYFRSQLASSIANEINRLFDPGHSFSVGIVGPWGSGKSTFLKYIENEIKRSRTNIIIHFNAWQYPGQTDLSEAFLQEVERNLRPYSISAGRYINQYIHRLFNGNSSLWNVFMNALFPAPDTKSLHQSMKEVIRESGKKLIVFIDDIDRLQSREVYEILTIIRNIGDLPNTLFVLAYDKDYLTKILDKTIVEPQEYLSKFFQVEYALGKIDEQKIQDELVRQLQVAFPNLKNRKHNTRPATDNIDEQIDIPVLIQTLEARPLLKTRRDIIKLLNNIQVTWPLFQNEIRFKDFLNLEIFRLKYGNVYTKIKYSNASFIQLKENAWTFISTSKENLTELVPSENDRKVVHNILTSLFPDTTNHANTDNLSVNNALRFDLYFLNQLAEHVSYRDLITLRQAESWDDLTKVTDGYLASPVAKEELAEYLLNLRSYHSLEDFKNMFRLMFQVDTVYQNHSDRMLEQIIVAQQQFSPGEVDKLVEIYLAEELDSTTDYSNFFYALGQQLSEGSDEEILPDEMIKSISLRRFERYLESSNQKMSDVFQFLYSCREKIDPDGKVHLLPEALKTMQAHARKRPGDYLRELIRPKFYPVKINQHYYFVLEPFTDKIFEGWENIETFLDQQAEASDVDTKQVQQIQLFYNEYKRRNFEVVPFVHRKSWRNTASIRRNGSSPPNLNPYINAG